MKTTRAIVGAVVAMSLVANAVMAKQAGAGRPRQKFKGPLKVFILAGQSNMQGWFGVSTLDSMADDPKTAPILKELRDADGKPRVCQKVWISSIGCAEDDTTEQKGKLTVGFGAEEDRFGPEFPFGIYMEKLLGEPILLIKTSWGGKSLHTDFRPPGAGPYVWSDYELAQCKRRGDDLEKDKADKVKATGMYYRLMIEHVRKVLADIKRVVPEYDPKQGYELAGFLWFQGWNDLCADWTYDKRMQPGGYDMYGQLLAQFIRDVRKDLSTPKMPFVIGVAGMGGVKEASKPPMLYFCQAQAAPASLPEFQGNVVAVQTAPYWDDELAALQTRMDKLDAKMNDEAKKNPSLTPGAKDAALKKAIAENFTPAELKRLKGVSHTWGIHYLGAAKIMGPIGKAFAEAMANLQTHAAEPDFYAYYTRLDYTQPPTPEMLGRIPVNAARTFAGGKPDKADETPRPPRQETMRWGQYADLVVNVAEGRLLVFSRATGYLPNLQTARGKFPFRQLAECREDLLCLCSYVRLVEDKPERVVVHWRHVPDPVSVVMTEEIHEYFIITPDGKVRREVRIGTERLDDFNDPANVTVQELALSTEGIKELSLAISKRSRVSAPAVSGSQVRDLDGPLPAAWLKFDDGLSPSHDETIEAVGRAVCPVAGNKTLWKRGISGTALAFDGYFTKVTLPKDKARTVRDELTLEAWVVLGAYPWNDAGIVHRSAGEPISAEDYKHGYQDPYVYRPWKVEGYMLGVDPYGRPIFKVNGKQIGGGVLEHKETVAKGDVLPTYRWTHLAATYGQGWMCLYVDGRLRASGEATGPIVVPDRDVQVGLNGDAQRVSDPVSHSKFAANNNMPLVYGIEGLIDEVMIYDRALTAEEIRKSFRAFSPPEADLIRPDLERRILPGAVDGSPARKFGATFQTLKFHELWDNLWQPSAYRDIVVRFDTVPCSVVFWQGTNFGSGWVTENNKWMSDQSWEIGGPHGCAEHMADKRGRFNHVRLIENTDARVVVHWRYAAFDVGYVFPGMNVWVDEYYTIYPDGVGVRFVDGHDGGWHDTQFLSQPGTTCLDNMELTALSVANLSGKSADLTWALPKQVPGNTLKDACIKRINFKSKWKVFAIYKNGVEIETWGVGEQSKHTPDPFAGPWNHWPVGLNPSDGRFAVSDDRVTHAALGGANNEGEFILYGFTDQPVTNLVVLAKSWNHPPAISVASGCEYKGYDQSQRAYVLDATARTISFSLQGSRDTPVFNPCFVIKHWDSDAAARVAFDGKPVQPGKTLRQGIVRDVDGRRSIVIWLELNSISAIRVSISGD